jgi:hypothetical protein
VRPLRNSERPIYFLRIEANDRLTTDQGDRSGHGAKAPELIQSRNILSDITIAEFYALLRKILFRVLAEHSAGLRKNDYWGAHIC